MLGLVAEETTCRFEGNYHHEGRWNPFSGFIVVQNNGIITGEDLYDDDGAGNPFNIQGFLIFWSEIPVMIFLKRYSDGSDFYYQIHKKDDSQNFEGEWEGNWTASLSDKARILLYEVLLGFKSIDQVEEGLQSGGSRHPFTEMRDIMTGQASRKTQGEWTVEVILSVPN